MRAALAVLALAAFALAASSARADDGARARLHALARRYEQHLLAERPDLASRYGARGVDDRLEPVTEATLERDARLLAELRGALDALDRAALSPAERTALDTLRVRCAREAAPLDSGAWRREPALYRELASGSVLAAAERPHVTACERTRRAIRRLRAVPEVLRAAEVCLRDATRIDGPGEAAAWTQAMMAWRTRLPAIAADCHDAERYADLVEADSLALGAARHFARWLEDTAATPRAR